MRILYPFEPLSLLSILVETKLPESLREIEITDRKKLKKGWVGSAYVTKEEEWLKDALAPCVQEVFEARNINVDVGRDDEDGSFVVTFKL